MTRRRTSIALLAVGFVLAVLAGPLRYVATVIEDDDAFVSLATDVIDDPTVRREVARHVTELTFESLEADVAVADLLPEQARAIAAPLTRIASEVVTDAAFVVLDAAPVRQVADPALRDVHAQLTAGGDDVVVDLRATMVRTSRELGGPAVGTGVAKVVTATDVGAFTLVDSSSPGADVVDAVLGLPDVGELLALVVAVALAGAVVVSPDRRAALVRAGLVLAAASAAGLLAVAAVLHLVLGRTAVGSSVARIVSTDLAAHQQGAIVAGVVVAAVGLLLGPRPAAVALRGLPGRAWRRDGVADAVAVIIGDNPPLARLVVWSAGALALMAWPAPTVRVGVTIAGVTVAALAVIWLFTSSGANARRTRERLSITAPIERPAVDHTARVRVALAVVTLAVAALWPAWSVRGASQFFVAGALVQAAADLRAAWALARTSPLPAAEAERSRPAAGGPPPTRWLVAAALTVIAGMALGAALTVGSTGEARASEGCNGHVELCDRSIDEVVFAGSHNAMAATDLGWDLAMQTHDIVTQLDLGIRSLLIDTHHWDSTGSAEVGDTAASRAVIEAALSDDRPRPGTWLCHGFCALGATDLTAELSAIRLWMESHPHEVLLFIVQDEIPTDETYEAFAESGLDQLVHTHEPGTPWPTLGELIEADERLIVYAENEGSPDSWYQNAWDTAFLDTPYTFAVRSDFTCEPNRGDVDNPLFLINHWITTGIPVREAFEVINRRDVLLDRVEQCRDELDREPTVLAVDFVETGDLFEVVDELNGVADDDDG